MSPSSITPVQIPTTRIIGKITPQRRHLLACVDVAVGYVCAQHRVALAGWHVEAALVEARPGFRGGETVALRATPLGDRSPQDLPPVPLTVLRQIASRITRSMRGIANVVPDIAAPMPDVEGHFAHCIAADDAGWFDEDTRSA